MDKFTINGAKKLHKLARTKIQLAKEADIVYTILMLADIIDGVKYKFGLEEFISEGSEPKNINVILEHRTYL